MKVIGISGKIGTGKTTLANELLKLLPGWERRGFADELKEEVSRKGIPLDWCYNKKDNVLPSGHTVREVLQNHGETKRKEYYNYWIDRMYKYVNNNKNNKGIIIDDVRYLNEARYIKSFKDNSFLIRLEPYKTWDKKIDHISETELDNYDNWDLKIYPEFGELSYWAGYINDYFLR